MMYKQAPEVQKQKITYCDSHNHLKRVAKTVEDKMLTNLAPYLLVKAFY